MSVDDKTVKRIADLACLAIRDDETESVVKKFNTVLGFVEQLNEIDVHDVAPLTVVTPTPLRMRKDCVTDDNDASDILANAPLMEENFFLVSKIIK